MKSITLFLSLALLCAFVIGGTLLITDTDPRAEHDVYTHATLSDNACSHVTGADGKKYTYITLTPIQSGNYILEEKGGTKRLPYFSPDVAQKGIGYCELKKGNTYTLITYGWIEGKDVDFLIHYRTK